MNFGAACRLAARWIVVALTALMLLGSRASDGVSTSRAQKQSCKACVRCTCCVERAPTLPEQPLSAPAPTRASAQKDFQLLLSNALLIFEIELEANSPPVHILSVSSLPVAPLYERHCAYLI